MEWWIEFTVKITRSNLHIFLYLEVDVCIFRIWVLLTFITTCSGFINIQMSWIQFTLLRGRFHWNATWSNRFRALSVQFSWPGSFHSLKINCRAVSEQLQSNYRAITEQLQSNSWKVQDQFQWNCSLIAVHFQSSFWSIEFHFSAVSGQFQWNWIPISVHLLSSFKKISS